MNGLIPQFIVGDLTGTITVGGIDAATAQIGELARKIGYVYQDFENQLVRPTVLDEASFSCLNYAYDDYIERGMRALDLCGLSDRGESYIWQLSGGQKHLLALAGGNCAGTGVIVLDEPVAQLDPYHAQKTYEVLRDLNENHGKTIIVIEHHTDFIAKYCKSAALMRNGTIAWTLPARGAAAARGSGGKRTCTRRRLRWQVASSSTPALCRSGRRCPRRWRKGSPHSREFRSSRPPIVRALMKVQTARPTREVPPSPPTRLCDSAT